MEQKVKIVSAEILSDEFFPLKQVTYEVQKKDGSAEEIKREVYLSGNGATALLYNKAQKTIILIRQFRLPAYLNKHPTGMLIETCAGLVEENEDPTDCIKREIEEETGYKVQNAKKYLNYTVLRSVAEMLHFYIAEYKADQRTGKGGGLNEESEDIEVIEMPFEVAYNNIQSGEIKDAKTVILLQYAKMYLFTGEKVFDIL